MRKRIDKFVANTRGGNAFLSSGKGPVHFDNCEFVGAFTSALEVEEHTTVALDACRFTKAQCGVGLHGPDCEATLRGCVFRECETAVKAGVGAKALPTGCSFVRCARGVHLSGDVAALRANERSLVLSNTFELCGERVHLEAMEEGVEGADGVANEVRQAIAKGMCTFLITGPHYRRQLVRNARLSTTFFFIGSLSDTRLESLHMRALADECTHARRCGDATRVA